MAVMDLVGQRPLVIFSKSNCCICYPITQLFYDFGANLAIYELDQLQNGKQLERELVALGPQPSVPVVFIGGKLVGGSNEVMSLQVDQGGAEERTLEGQGYSSLELMKGGKIN